MNKENRSHKRHLSLTYSTTRIEEYEHQHQLDRAFEVLFEAVLEENCIDDEDL